MLRSIFRKFYVLPPRKYAEAARSKGDDYRNPESVNIQWGHQDDYEIIDYLGKGKYSEVQKGVNLLTLEPVVLKVLKPTRPVRVCREIKILQYLSGKYNTVKLKEVIKDYASQVPTLVLEYVENPDHRAQIKTFTDFDIRYYMYEISKSLDYCHSLGIIHRDVKTSNIMIDHKQRKCRLIDWGLAEFYVPDHKLSVRVASKPYKAPELLLGYEFYDYSLDSWCLGATMAGMIFQKDPFFNGEDNDRVLLNIIHTLGSEEFNNYLAKYQIESSNKILKSIEKTSSKSLSKFITQENKHLVSKDAIDLLAGLLMYDHHFRLLPKEIMEHAYFDPVKEMWSILNSGAEIPSNKPYTQTAEILRKRLSTQSKRTN